MIHDLDLLTMFIGEKPIDIRAKGAAILTHGPDIVNVRLQYASGCVANLTASRVSIDPMRKVRVFSENGYVSIDLLKKQVRHVRKRDTFDEGIARLMRTPVEDGAVSLADFIEITESSIKGEEQLFDELQSFCQTIVNGATPTVTGEDGLHALEIATEIQRLVTEE